MQKEFLGDEGENILFSDEEFESKHQYYHDKDRNLRENRDTILDEENLGFTGESPGRSSVYSYENENEGISPLLECFCKKGEVGNLKQFKNLILGDTYRLLLHRAIEYR